jgi:ketosteroid isomerase-like protein
MTRFLGTILALSVALAGMHVFSGNARADDSQNVGTYRQFVDAINRGDAARALSFFADDAQLSGPSPFCFPNPCAGRAAIQRQLEAEVNALHLQLQFLGSVNVVNGNVTALMAHRADPIRAAGLSRVMVTETVTFRGDRISKFIVDLVTTDPQSAAFGRLRSQPAPAPAAAPAPVIQAPSTGDGGLLSTSSGSGAAAPASLILISAAIFLSATVTGKYFSRLAKRIGQSPR